MTRSFKTHCMTEKKPPIFLYDSPGMFPPVKFLEEDPENVFKLAVVNAILPQKKQDYKPVGLAAVVGNDLTKDCVCGYLLWLLNTRRKFAYVSRYDLSSPTENLQHLYAAVEKWQHKFLPPHLAALGANNKTRKGLLDPSEILLRDFNDGSLGGFVLDDLSTLDSGERRAERASIRTNRQMIADLEREYQVSIPMKRSFKKIDTTRPEEGQEEEVPGRSGGRGRVMMFAGPLSPTSGGDEKRVREKEARVREMYAKWARKDGGAEEAVSEQEDF